MPSELVKIVSSNPAHPHGYYTQFRNRMKPDDVEYIEGEIADPVWLNDLSVKPIKNKSRRKNL